MRTISKSLKYNDDRALVPTGMEGRRLPKKFLKQVNKLQRSNSLTRKVFGTRLRRAFACFASRGRAQRLSIKRLANDTRIVTHFAIQ